MKKDAVPILAWCCVLFAFNPDLMVLPAVILVFIFSYMLMYGLLMAFQNYIPAKGIIGSDWVGLKHFKSFFRDPFCWGIIKNTVVLGAYSLLFTFPAPIILALLLNELTSFIK